MNPISNIKSVGASGSLAQNADNKKRPLFQSKGNHTGLPQQNQNTNQNDHRIRRGDPNVVAPNADNNKRRLLLSADLRAKA